MVLACLCLASIAAQGIGCPEVSDRTVKQVRIMTNTTAPGHGDINTQKRVVIEGEPDLATGTLEDWMAFRQTLAALPQDDENVRIAIAVAHARIEKLHRDKSPRTQR